MNNFFRIVGINEQETIINLSKMTSVQRNSKSITFKFEEDNSVTSIFAHEEHCKDTFDRIFNYLNRND